MTTQDHSTTHGSFDDSLGRAEQLHPVSEGARSGVHGQPPVDAPSTAGTNPQSPNAPMSDATTPSAMDQQYQPSPSTASAEAAHGAVQPARGGSATEQALFADDELEEMRGRWTAVQAAFVDDPKECVQKADVLVSDVVEQLTNGFASARARLEEQWSRGEQASTEDLRVALMHYREFFERLLAV